MANLACLHAGTSIRVTWPLLSLSTVPCSSFVDHTSDVSSTKVWQAMEQRQTIHELVHPKVAAALKAQSSASGPAGVSAKRPPQRDIVPPPPPRGVKGSTATVAAATSSTGPSATLRNRDGVTVIGIGGATRSGKSCLVEALKQHFKPSRVASVCQDKCFVKVSSALQTQVQFSPLTCLVRVETSPGSQSSGSTGKTHVGWTIQKSCAMLSKL